MIPRFLKLNSLRARLMLLVLLALTPSAVMTVLNGWQARLHTVKVAQENLQRLTNLAAANEAQLIERGRQILRDLSGIPDLLASQALCTELLSGFLRKNPNYANFGLIQLNGDVTCSAIELAGPVNLADRPNFQRAIKERRFIAGNHVFGRVIQKHTINLTYPVIDAQGKVVAVVFVAVNLSDLDKFVDEIKLSPGSLLLTADAQGTLISRRPNPTQWYGKKVSVDMKRAMASMGAPPQVIAGEDGVKRMHAFARVGSNDLSDYMVSIGIPMDDIVARARRDQLMALIGLAATIALALIATWFVGEILIVRRVRTLGQTANRIAAGSLGSRTGMDYGTEEIGQLAHALDRMAEALQKKEAAHQQAEERLRIADKRKDEFLAVLAHELRNPLAPISAGAELLKLSQGHNASVLRSAEMISRQVDHISRLVDDLLDVSRVNEGLVTLSSGLLDLNSVVANALEQTQPLIHAKRHRLDVLLPHEGAQLHGDHKRLVQVLANLLNNSAKYTPEGGHIRLALELTGNEAVLTVADNGIGMEPALVARVFELFAQGERTPDRSKGGLGLGLALVKKLVELHGGTVAAQSHGAGKGSTFTIRLPRIVERPRLEA